MKQHPNLIMFPSALLLIICAWIILQVDITASNESSQIFDLQIAAAAVQYGIQGQRAPDLNLTTWIDGKGLPIDPIELSDYRGKIIYLYFFQDW